MSLFDEIERRDDPGMTPGESKFAYWNRSGRRGFDALRARVDDLVSRYPEPHRDTLTIRLKSDDDVAHESALFELLLHHAFVSSDVHVEAIEPSIPHTDKSPDFLIRLPDGARLYVEATLATGLSDSERRSKKRLDSVVQALNSVRSSDFWLEVELKGTPSEPVRLRRLRQAVERWLRDLNYDEVRAQWDDENRRDLRPEYRHSEHDLTIAIRPIPKTDRRDHERAIGLQSGGVWARTVGAALRQAIEGKANRYGDLDLPYVVAVNGLDHNAEEHDVMAALFGQDVYKFTPGAQDSGRWDRDWDGAWISPNNVPRRQGVSGVLVFDGLAVWGAKRKRGLFVHNPWARLPVESCPIDVDELKPRDGEFKRREGRSFAEIVGWDDGE